MPRAATRSNTELNHRRARSAAEPDTGLPLAPNALPDRSRRTPPHHRAQVWRGTGQPVKRASAGTTEVWLVSNCLTLSTGGGYYQPFLSLVGRSATFLQHPTS